MERADNEQWKSRAVAQLLALVESERRYWQDLVTTLPVPLAILDGQLKVLSANRAFRTTFRIRNADLRSIRIDEILKTSVELKPLVQNAIESRDPSPPVTLAVEGIGLIRVSIVPHRDWDEDTETHALIVIERMETDSSVAPLAPRAPAIAKETPAVLWIADLPGMQFSFVSDSAELVCGIPADRWRESGFWKDRVSESDQETVIGHYEGAIAMGGSRACEFRLRDNANWFRETIRIDVEAQKVYGVMTDISERRTLDEHLLQSQRMDALATFSGRTAHDLNNRLMIVSGYGEEILDSLAESDSRRDDMSQVLQAAGKIGDLAAQLQSFSRKPPKAEMDPSGTDLGMLLQSASKRIAEKMTVHAEAPDGLRVVAMGPVLENLICEIANAMAEGAGAEAKLTLRASESILRELPMQGPEAPLVPGTYAFLLMDLVSNGEGPKRPLFEQLNSNPALALAFREVESWGGSIWVARGSKQVRVLLRMLAPASVTEVVRPAPTPPPPPPPPPAKRILVVDNEQGIRSLIRKILTREGYAAKEALDANDALTILERESYDLLLTDVVMPEMSGRELAEKAVAMRPSLRVLYVSGFTDGTLVETGQFPPGSQFLQKPFTLGSLLRKVKELMAA